jgi:hypothetical protein
MRWAKMLVLVFAALAHAGCAKTRFVEAHSETTIGTYPGGAGVASHGTYSDECWWGPACLRTRPPISE